MNNQLNPLEYFFQYLISEIETQKTFSNSCLEGIIDVVTKDPQQLRTLSKLL